MKKTVSLFMLITAFNLISNAQSVGINFNGAPPNSSAALDLDVSALVNKKGLLIPRITLTQRIAMNPLPATAQGLLVYQTDGVQGFYYNTSITSNPSWIYLTPGGGSAGWGLTGNAGTVDGTNFIGTTDDVPLNLLMNNFRAGRIEGPSQWQNTYFGYGSGGTLTPPAPPASTGFGYKALANNTGQFNVAMGFNSMLNNANGGSNSAFGANTLSSNINGIYNTAVGTSALNNNKASDNTALGYGASGFNNNGAENSATGGLTLYLNTSGSRNTANGFKALYNNIESNNTAIGNSSLYYNTSGSYNTALGYLSGSADFSTNANTTGSYNVFIGYNTGSSPGTLQNAIAIGKNARVEQSNAMILGGTGPDAVNVGIGTNNPKSTLEIAGSISTAITSTSSDLTLTKEMYTVIISGAGGITLTLPAVNSCIGRIYVIVNHPATISFTSVGYINSAGISSTNITGNTILWLQSDGTNWQQIK